MTSKRIFHITATLLPALIAIGLLKALVTAEPGSWTHAIEPRGSERFDGAPGRQLAERQPIRSIRGDESRYSVRPGVQPAVARIESSEPLPESLSGSIPDGLIRFDSRGLPIIDRELRHRFDYWLTSIGEKPLSTIRDQFEISLTTEFGARQAAAVLAEFNLYTEYLLAVDSMLSTPSASQRQKHAAQAELQQLLLGSSRAEAWFGEENRYIEHSLAMRQNGPAPDQPVPRPFGYDPRKATEHHFAMELESQYRHLEIDAGQRRDERRELFGDEAARRLDRLDAQRNRWNRRVEDFARQRRQLLNNGLLTPAEAARAIDALLVRSFDPAEQRRIKALTETGMLQGGSNDS